MVIVSGRGLLKGVSHLFLCNLHESNEQVEQLWENWQEEGLIAGILPKDTDKLKHSKYGTLLTYDLSIGVIYFFCHIMLRIHHTFHIPGTSIAQLYKHKRS